LGQQRSSFGSFPLRCRLLFCHDWPSWRWVNTSLKRNINIFQLFELINFLFINLYFYSRDSMPRMYKVQKGWFRGESLLRKWVN
jgi:hypothetical protein